MNKLLEWFGDVYTKEYTELTVDGVPIEKVLHPERYKEPELIVSDSIEDNPELFRPLEFDQYIGQDNAKTILKAFLKGTKKRNKTFPHLLIYGSAGCGKTTLAKIIAKQLGVKFQEILSTKIEDINELLEVFENADGGVIFLDEIHALSRGLVEPLYPIMEDFRFGGKKFKPFTLIGATTEVGEIIKTRRPFYDRFKIKQELEDYKTEHLKEIIKQYMEKTFKDEELQENTYIEISKNCRVTPRIGIALLEATVYLDGDFKMAQRGSGIIFDGYTNKDLEYLETIAQYEKGLGLNAISSSLRTSNANITHDIEPYLIKNKLILITKSGRIISEKGKIILDQLKEKS